MLCPFCLKENTITKVEEGGRKKYVCSEHPEPTIPIIYAEKDKIPRDLISAIGFRGHGKSAYFTSLFASLDSLSHRNIWPCFSYNPANEQSLDIVYTNVRAFNDGKLPPATPVNFPIPTIVEFSDMPKFKDRFLIFYDTGGENFERASRLIKNAEFVKKSQTAIFFISLNDINYNPQEMHRLLSVYIQGLRDIGGNTKEQQLLVVLTKGDLLSEKLKKYPAIWEYLVKGNVKNTQYSNIRSQLSVMKKVSKLLKDFLEDDIGAGNFIQLGRKNFNNIEFCIISALGSAPEGDQLDINATPKRIFDPIIWVMNNSTRLIPPFFFNRKATEKPKSDINPPPPDPNPRNQNKKYLKAIIVLIFVAGGLGVFFPILTDFAEEALENQKAFSTYILEGDKYLEQGKYYEAIQKYNDALSLNNKSAEAWERRGDAYSIFSKIDRFKINEALLSYQNAMEINPENYNYSKKIGDLYFDNGKYENAFTNYNNAVTLNPDLKPEISYLIKDLLKSAESHKNNRDYIIAIGMYNGILNYKYLDSQSEKKALSERLYCQYKCSYVGSWDWIGGKYILIISDNGTALCRDKKGNESHASWKFSEDGSRIIITWTDGWWDNVQLSHDGNSLEGINKGGARVYGSRIG